VVYRTSAPSPSPSRHRCRWSRKRAGIQRGARSILGWLILIVFLAGCVKAQVPVFETQPSTAISVPPTGSSGQSSPGQVSEPQSISPPVRLGRIQPNAAVVHLVDGDTLDVVFTKNSKRERIRLIGIDTPESKRPNTPIECFAKKAAGALASITPEGTMVRVDPDVEERDQYGRYLGYIYRAQDGLFVNLEMARVGMAVPLTFPPNVAHVDEFLKAGDDARAAQIGLWSACSGPHTPENTIAGAKESTKETTNSQ
jgi:micrococcal nuclease